MKNKTELFLLLLVLPFLSGLIVQCQSPEKTSNFPDRESFLTPEAKYKAHAGLNYDLQFFDEERAREEMQHFHERGFGGVFVEPENGNAGDLPEWYIKQAAKMRLGKEGMLYLGEDYIRVYRAFLDEADKLGMKVILYDDYRFPTGQVAGQFFQQFPEDMADRLDKVETDLQGPGILSLEVPEGTYLGAALWNTDNNVLQDVSSNYDTGKVRCQVQDGNWKLMAFYLNHKVVLEMRNPGIMNYLEEKATDNFISISYNKFYEGFGEYFDNVIPMSFYDEPSLHWMDGRMWSEDINKLYEDQYGESPIKYYPALWYDIGENTAAARNAIHGLRARMFCVNFVKRLNDWCAEHNLMLSGHMDQEEVANPVMSNGDLMKVFEYQDIPGADDINTWGRSNPGYKIVTSSSYNYDKAITWAETYAAYRACDRDTAYKVAMDQYAMGINMQTPFPSKLESAMSLEELVEFNGYIGRLSYMLQGGRHVSDIAILYPIASAQATNVFGEGWMYGYKGGEIAPELDYQVVGEDLFMGLRVDYTYLHPEVLDERCVIKGNQLILDNAVNREEYRLFIIPGGNTMKVSTAQKLLQYYREGGKIIATTRLPIYSAEFNKDKIILSAMEEIFSLSKEEIRSNKRQLDKPYILNKNSVGGEAYFIPDAHPELLEKVVNLCLPVRDVRFEEPRWNIGSWDPYKTGHRVKNEDWIDRENSGYKGALTYTHKVKNGKDIYFFANSSSRDVVTKVALRGKKGLRAWDPHEGRISELEYGATSIDKTPCTEFTLTLGSTQSIFIIGE